MNRSSDDPRPTGGNSQLAPEIAAAQQRGIVFHNFTIQWRRDHPEGRVRLQQAVKLLAGR